MHPAEFAKLALIVYLAHWLAKRGGQISSLVHGLVPFLVIAGPIILLVAIEPDLGTTGVITLSAVTMLFVAGASLWQMVLMAPVGLAALVTYISNKAYQQNRIDVFLDPWKYAAGDGYQTVHALLALAMGGIFGIGLGQSSQPGGLYVPNSDNDFIFAIVGQELGLVGAVAVVGLYLFFAYRGVKVALGAPDTFGALLAIGITAWLTIQAFINIGVVLLIIPNTGITLPFISSGGSSLVVSFAAVGILLSISRETQARGTWNDADPDRGRGYGRPHLPRTGRPERTRRRHADLDVRWVGGHRGLESSVVPTSGHRLDRLWLRSLRTVDLSVATIADPLRLGASVPQAAAILARFRPHVIYTTGGYVSIPVLTAAAAGRVPTLLWEGNRVPGRSVRATARLASAIAVSFEGTCESLPGRCFVTGTPIRPFAGIERDAARAHLGLPADLPVALVFGGSQAVRRLNEAVADALPSLVERFAVLHLTGETATPRPSAAARRCRPIGAAATVPTRSCATTWRRRWWPRTSSSGAPARRRSPRPRPSACR